MAKVKTPNQKSKYRALNKRLAGYVLLVEQIYDELNLEAAKLALTTDYDGSKPFRFKDFPNTRDRVQKLKKKFVEELKAVIYSGTSKEWKQSNLVQDLLADKVLKAFGVKHRGKKERVYYQVNSDALKAFQERKINGMGLSANLWNQAANYREELEYAISSAIQKGTSAVTLSKRLSKYLKDFPKLQKEYKQKFGKAVDCHDCEYRSIRLARSEINMSYRTAEQTRWQQMDFVVGYEIKLSAMHPGHDVCDSLAGKYPKDFKWTGWHPNDMCYVVPILSTEDEFWSDSTTSVNEVKDVPESFKKWVNDNRERIDQAEKRGTLPYFVRDNKEYAGLAKKKDTSVDAVLVDKTEVRVKAKKKYDTEYEAPFREDVFKDMTSDETFKMMSNGKVEDFEDFCKQADMKPEVMQELFEAVVESSDVYMAIDGGVLEKKIIGGDGLFKSSIETGKGTFSVIGEERAVKERLVFGLADDCPIEEFPKYGFLSQKGKMTYEQIVDWGYGDVYVCFDKNKVGGRSTITIGDSYHHNRYHEIAYLEKKIKETEDYIRFGWDEEQIARHKKDLERYQALLSKKTAWTSVAPPTRMDSPDAKALIGFSNRTDRVKDILYDGIDKLGDMSGQYVECQMYGKLSINDVARIEVSSVKRKKSLEKALKKAGLDIEIVPAQFDSRVKFLEGGITAYSGDWAKYAYSLHSSDVDNLGDYFINGLSKRFAGNTLAREKIGRTITDFVGMDDFVNLARRIDIGEASITEKRAFLKMFYDEMASGYKKGRFPKSWYDDYRKSLGGWTTDVLNKDLLNRS